MALVMSCSPRLYSAIDLSSAFKLNEAAKEHKVYVSHLEVPVTVTTPPLTLDTPIDPTSASFAVLSQGGPQFTAFLENVQSALLDAVVANKLAVLGRAVSDETLKTNQKTFLDDDAVKVRVTDDVHAFDVVGRAVDVDHIPAGSRVRCVLELARVCFGRAEWGGMWRVVQVRACETCHIPDADPEESEEDLADAVEEYL